MIKATRRVTHSKLAWEDFEEEAFSLSRTTGVLPFNAVFTIYDRGASFEIVMDADEEPVLELFESNAFCISVGMCHLWALEKVRELQDLAVMVRIFRSATK